MGEVLHANIFFFITGIAVVICSLLICVLLFHLIRAARALRRIIDTVEAGAEVLADDMQQLRTAFSDGSFITKIVQMFMGRGRGGARRGAKVDKKKAELEITNE
jgi:hypothetical protein